MFPRSSVWIRRPGEPPFVADPGVVTFYDEGQEYSRRPISPDGDRAEWFGIAPEVAAEVLGAAGGSRIFRRSHAPVPPRFSAAQRRLLERVAAGGVEPLEVEERVIALLSAVTPATAGSARRTGSPHRRDFEGDVREVLATTLGERVTSLMPAELVISGMSTPVVVAGDWTPGSARTRSSRRA